jgi:hypothetical protein|tara:strand:- start:18204 stop:18533 length:330 start_codon:yes stop_codon:yes gene_type:complete
MDIAIQAMKILRESQDSRKESSFMTQYSNLLLEIHKMEDELNTVKSKLSNQNFELKRDRVNGLKLALISFSECYFLMCSYKEQSTNWKYKYLEKEMEYINFVNKGLQDE